MEVFNLVDERFSHDIGTVAGIVPRKVQWERDRFDSSLPVFFSHEKMLNVRDDILKHRRFGLLFESRSQAEVYRDVSKVMNEYSLVFTHSSELLKAFPNSRWIPGGGIWIGGSHGGRESPSIFPKSRDVSIVSSNKLRCPAHRMRYELARQLEHGRYGVDVFRQTLGGDNSPVQLIASHETKLFGSHVPALWYLQDYRYSIVMENFIDDFYFTEKILNCFASGTVPIYRGARDISKLFNSGGIISWDSPAQLVGKILPTLGDEDYKKRREAIAENFSLASKFRTIEDFIHDSYLDEIQGFRN